MYSGCMVFASDEKSRENLCSFFFLLCRCCLFYNVNIGFVHRIWTCTFTFEQRQRRRRMSKKSILPRERCVCVCVTCCLGSFTITAFRCNSRALCICFTSSQHIEREQNTYSRCVYLNAYKYASLPYELKRFISRHIALLIIFSVLSSRCIFIRCKLYTRFHTIAVTILSLFSLLHLAAEVGFGVLLLLLQLHSSCVANFSLQFFSPSTFVKSEGKKR